MVGLPSAPLRCINYIPFSDGDKASFLPKIIFGLSVLAFSQSSDGSSPVLLTMYSSAPIYRIRQRALYNKLFAR